MTVPSISDWAGANQEDGKNYSPPACAIDGATSGFSSDEKVKDVKKKRCKF